MTVLYGLLPALILLGGALLAILPLPFSILRRWLPIAVCLVALFALLWLARETEPLTLLPPNDALPDLSLTLQWNGAVIPFGVVLLVVLMGRLLIGLESDMPSFRFGVLSAAGGALLFLAADNFTTVAAAWVLVELGLLVVPLQESEPMQAAARAFGWNLIGIVAWLTAGMVAANQGSGLKLTAVTMQGAAPFFVLLAIWIRSGVYPFQSAAPSGAIGSSIRIGLPLLLGGYLMTRFLLFAPAEMAFAPEMEILALVAAGASALIVVGQFHGSEALLWTARATGTSLFLLPFFANARVAPALGVWFSLGIFVLVAALEIAIQWRAELPGLRLTLLVWIGILVMVAALPFAPIFWARVGLLASAYRQIGISLWLLLTATMALILVPVWREIFYSGQVAPRTPALAEYAALVCVVAPALGLSIMPLMFLAPFGTAAQAGGGFALDALFKPANLPSLIFLLAGLGVPLLASFELARRWNPRASLIPLALTGVVDLTDLTVLLDAVYRLARGLIQQALALLEQPPIAWLLFLVIWVAVWVIGLSG